VIYTRSRGMMQLREASLKTSILDAQFRFVIVHTALVTTFKNVYRGLLWWNRIVDW